MGKDYYFDDLVKNAMDFMNKSLEELINDNLKSSVIDFYSSVELFLKARLLKEHWSLIVEKDPNINNFIKGDFISISFNTTIKRLRDVLNFNIQNNDVECIDIVRQHRNKMVHFFHTSLKDKKDKDIIINDLMRAWSVINKLIKSSWSDIFNKYSGKVDEIHHKLTSVYAPYVKKYLENIYENKEKEIKEFIQKGAILEACKRCDYKTFSWKSRDVNLKNGICLICLNSKIIYNVQSPCCGQEIDFFDNVASCPNCNANIDYEDLKNLLLRKGFDVDGDYEFHNINCTYCNSNSVIPINDNTYLCLECRWVSDKIEEIERNNIEELWTVL